MWSPTNIKVLKHSWWINIRKSTQNSSRPWSINIRKSNQNLHALYRVSLKKYLFSRVLWNTWAESHKATNNGQKGVYNLHIAVHESVCKHGSQISNGIISKKRHITVENISKKQACSRRNDYNPWLLASPFSYRRGSARTHVESQLSRNQMNKIDSSKTFSYIYAQLFL